MMPSKNPVPETRQVTVQPQEMPPEAGRPQVPHTRVKQPGQPPPAVESDEDEENDAGAAQENARRS